MALLMLAVTQSSRIMWWPTVLRTGPLGDSSRFTSFTSRLEEREGELGRLSEQARRQDPDGHTRGRGEFRETAKLARNSGIGV